MNLFPLAVTAGDITHRDARLVTYGACGHNMAIVWAWPGGNKPVEVLRIDDPSAIKVDGNVVTLPVEDGTALPLSATLTNGCGCGAKLKSYVPPCPACSPADRRSARRAS